MEVSEVSVWQRAERSSSACLFIPDKSVQDKMITDLFSGMKVSLPVFSPVNPANEYVPVSSISNSVLPFNTNWCKESGFYVNSNERKERCRRQPVM